VGVMGPRAFAMLATTLGIGVVAGVCFAFSTFVMPALARLPSEQGVAAMQSINIAAINRWFMGVLFGSGALALGLAIASVSSLEATASRWILAGALAYVGGVLAVTAFANVPRNDALAVMTPAASAAYWQRYVVEWTGWNHVRTVASIVATACFYCARG
jgi:uncharacterized membrane protein